MSEPPDNGRAERIAAVYAELETMKARDQDVVRAVNERARTRPGTSVSVVFSVRLDREELRALELRASDKFMPPSVLARNLIRSGLARRDPTDVSAALARVEEAVAALRTLVP